MSTGTIVVVGDALLDVDLLGRSYRTCPDAPAPVVENTTRRHRPGGAALTARLLSEHSGVDVVLVTALGADAAATEVARGLGAGVVLVTPSPRAHTPTKTRVQTAEGTVARVDEGCEPGFAWRGGTDMYALLDGASAVLVSDYGLGMTGQEIVRDALARVVGRVPVVWDPHPRGAPPVPGTALVTPNEAESFLGGAGALRTPEERARSLVARWGADAVAVTLGEEGAVWCDRWDEGGRTAPSPVRTPVDTCGAGDAFAAACARSLASAPDTHRAVCEGARAATAFVGRGAAGAHTTPVPGRGPAVTLHTPSPVTEAVRRGGGRVVATGGCFDVLHAGHVDLLRRARALGDHLVVLLNDDASVRALKGEGRPVVHQHDRIRVLSALDCVDSVVLFDELTPVRALERLRPDMWVKGGDYDPDLLPETPAVRNAGGEVVTVPLLAGRSSTRLIDRIREHEDVPAT
ncbi:PfkB family carbohydrate kinase [Nocardiopsis sp. NPDC006938]|uniref:PfkB family carbohydrate kinase n=1 Tax=Nocardiopsis sp. NPDC006938 TaxID=3364337 RepID=UPI0036A99DC1